MDTRRKVGVIGHRNPDTDSICSAIAYAALKNATGEMSCEPLRAGAGALSRCQRPGDGH